MASSFSVKLDLGDLSAGCREGVAREGLGDSDCAVSSPGGGVWAALAAAVGWNRSDTPRSGSPRLGVQGDVADGRSDGRAGTATPHPRDLPTAAKPRGCPKPAQMSPQRRLQHPKLGTAQTPVTSAKVLRRAQRPGG